MRNVGHRLFAVVFVPAVLAALLCGCYEYRQIDSMDAAASTWKLKPDNQMSSASDTDAKEGDAALKIVCDEGWLNGLAWTDPKADESWNDWDGLAFWAKGDGSENWALVEVWTDGYNSRRMGIFPLKNNQWHEVRMAWADLTPTGACNIGEAEGNMPSDISFLGFGKSWTFTPAHTKPAFEVSIDDVRLVKGVAPSRRRVSIDKLPPVATAIEKMKSGRPVTVLALGDSITATPGNDVDYPEEVVKMLQEHYDNPHITLVNAAIGGSTTYKGRQWLMRDVAGVQADLVTIMFATTSSPARPTSPAARNAGWTACNSTSRKSPA